MEPVRVGDADGTQSSTGELLDAVHIKVGISVLVNSGSILKGLYHGYGIVRTVNSNNHSINLNSQHGSMV